MDAHKNSVARFSHSSQTPNLPIQVVEHIFSFLSIKEITRMSVLSKMFRHSWRLCRDLSFDDDLARNLSRDKYKLIVCKFLKYHFDTSAADRCKLYYDPLPEPSLVSYWIHRAARLGIKELELDFTPCTKHFMLGYDLIDVESIRTIKLVNCDLYLPLNSNGLRHLREITLQNARARPVTVEAIFANCVSLKGLILIQCNSIYSLKASSQHLNTLVVKDCFDVHSIVVNAPSLQTLHYHGRITEFNFNCELLSLSDVILDIAHSRTFQLLSHRKDVVISLAFVKILTISSTFLEALFLRYEDYGYKNMEFFLWKLKEFHLLVAPESFLTPYDIVRFLKQCPCIERAFINLGENAFGNNLYWENRGRNYFNESQIVFPFLKYVKIKGFTMKELPVSMTIYFLKNAIHLQCIILVKAKIHHFSKSYSPECIGRGIVSNAKIEILDCDEDKVNYNA